MASRVAAIFRVRGWEDGMSVQGKVAVVTGGGSGIGRSAALALQGDGWNVVVAGRRKEELDKTVGHGQGRRRQDASAVRADVGKPEDVKSLFAETKKAFGGRLDFLFNNAGFGAPAGADGGPAVRDLEGRGRRHPARLVPVRAGGHQDHEVAEPEGRAHRQQRLDLGLHAAAQLGRLHRPPSTPSPASPSASRSTGASTTSPAASSTSATPTPPWAGA